MRTEQTKEHPAAKKQGGVKMVYFVPCRHLFLPITILAVMEWFTSADAFAIGITGFMQTVIVHGGLGLVAGDHRPCLIRTADSAGRNVFPAKVGTTAGILLCVAAAFFLVRPLVLDISLSQAPGSRLFGAAGI